MKATIIVGGICILVGMIVCAGLGQGVPLFGAYYLAAGWIHFLVRVIPQVTISSNALLTAFGALALFILGLHLFLRWLFQATLANGLGEDRKPWRFRWTLSLAMLVIVTFAAGIATVGVTHQIGWIARSPESLTTGGIGVAAARSQSQNNLKNFALASADWSEKNGRRLPPGYSTDSLGRPLHGCFTLILPHIEMDNAFRMINLDKPWNDPANQKASQYRIGQYHSAGVQKQSDDNGRSLTHYAANSHAFPPTSGLRHPADFTDGTANTILFGEITDGLRPWAHPWNLRDPSRGIRKTPDCYYGPWSNGTTQFTFADGSVRALKNKTSPAVLKALATPAGGEAVDAPLD